MNYYAQNLEDKFVHEYFGNYKGTLLEIGANQGKYLSNSLALIEQNWNAYLIEPGKTFSDLVKLHYTNPRVNLYNYAIGGEFCKVATFYESDAHVLGGSDIGLVSSLDFDETLRWRNNGVQFTETTVQVKSFREFYLEAGEPVLDFISIDAESSDWDILQQIDLTKVACKCLCIEHNGDVSLKLKYIEYCLQFGLHSKVINNENIILCR